MRWALHSGKTGTDIIVEQHENAPTSTYQRPWSPGCCYVQKAVLDRIPWPGAGDNFGRANHICREVLVSPRSSLSSLLGVFCGQGLSPMAATPAAVRGDEGLRASTRWELWSSKYRVFKGRGRVSLRYPVHKGGFFRRAVEVGPCAFAT